MSGSRMLKERKRQQLRESETFHAYHAMTSSDERAARTLFEKWGRAKLKRVATDARFLPLAAASGWETFVRRLLLYGVDVDTAAPPALRSDLNYARHVQDRNTSAFSPLLWACIGPPRSSHPACIRLLLEARHVNARNTPCLADEYSEYLCEYSEYPIVRTPSTPS
jgi:hypothetical protein